MLDKLRNLKNVITNTARQVQFDPTQFDDPLANSIRWTPIKSGGSNFRTHKFYSNGANQVGFKATLGAKLFSGIFAAVGTGVIIIPFYNTISEWRPTIRAGNFIFYSFRADFWRCWYLYAEIVFKTDYF